jgi:hypothetical protein
VAKNTLADMRKTRVPSRPAELPPEGNVAAFDDRGNLIDSGVSADDLLSAAGDKYLRHVQTEPLATWTIVHNFGRVPNVQVKDSEGVWWEVDPVHVDINTVQLNFPGAMAGEAYLT